MKEHALGEQKTGEKWGGVREKGEGVPGRKGIGVYFARLTPLPLLLTFRTSSKFRFLRVSFWKRLLRIHRLVSTAFSSSLKLSRVFL